MKNEKNPQITLESQVTAKQTAELEKSVASDLKMKDDNDKFKESVGGAVDAKRAGDGDNREDSDEDI